MEQILKQIRIMLNDKADFLAGGGVSDYAAYREVVGQIFGLAQAERVILDEIDRKKRDADFEE